MQAFFRFASLSPARLRALNHPEVAPPSPIADAWRKLLRVRSAVCGVRNEEGWNMGYFPFVSELVFVLIQFRAPHSNSMVEQKLGRVEQYPEDIAEGLGLIA